ncbi:MAG: hypothetical protein KKE51_09045 [Gammaproteobacteria bacterium]|nr:hypothetical protein [Gammaproteobacteria bacterium]MBU1602538.1 hypothetical protein [Gammaproteobacteria bacterium]MBU2433343.1 hypothetical protein [Gammaproteobacteria bacterium]MBU2451259.1 hypothetical protein [Gammaproteobacteria bacterium]
MENTNTDQITSEFTAAPGTYAIVGDRLDLEDQLNARVRQLNAMLSMTTGEQGETFRMLNDELQDSFMGACDSFIQEIKQLRKVIQVMNDAEQSEGASA